MTKEQLEKRKASLVSQLEFVRAQVHGINGMIQDCDYWLNELEKEETFLPSASQS